MSRCHYGGSQTAAVGRFSCAPAAGGRGSYVCSRAGFRAVSVSRPAAFGTRVELIRTEQRAAYHAPRTSPA